MLYQLPDGRTVQMSVYDYLELSDEELESLKGYSHIGVVINNPMYGSATKRKDDPLDEPYEELDEDSYFIEEEE